MIKLIECIPNFSEGRNKRKIKAIVSAISEVHGVKLLGYESDFSHNRSVVTFVGNPKAVFAAAFATITKAVQLIDLNKHRGEHPRLGAADVVPFVPISGVSFKECVALVHKLGEKIGNELHIPVYFYGKAAKISARGKLEDVRRGEYETIKKEIGKNKARDPDFGPSKIGKAGACIIGVRGPLIAYNVNLKTQNLEIAKEIAKKIRSKDGGLPCVKALGINLKEKKMTQVSMNLTDFKKTPPHVVFKAIVKEAKRLGVEVFESEIIGLVPHKALIKNAKRLLRIKNFSKDKILENVI